MSIVRLILLLCMAPVVRGADRFAFFEPVQPPRPFQVMVHRGGTTQAPENTRSALTRCIEDGFEWAEVDVRLTLDGKHLLSHGNRLSTGTDEAWRVSEHDLEELKTADVGSYFAPRFAGEPPLSLQECFDLCKGKLNLYLDCKRVNPEQLAQEILAAGMEHQTVVYDSPDNLRRIHEIARGKIALMTKWHSGFGIQSWVESNHLAAVEIDAPEITPETTRLFHDLGIKVQIKVLGGWDTHNFWNKGLQARADWYQTDLPEELLAHTLWGLLKKAPVRFSLHRGAGRYAPENTLPAFEKALRLGAHLVEFDVRSTSDGMFYLLHDSTLDRCTSGTGPISNTPSSVIETLSAGIQFGRPFADTRMPTLETFLSDIEGKVDLYFDAKAISPEALAEAVNRHHMAERTVVYQSVPYLMRLKAIDPRIRTLPPLGSPGDVDPIAARLNPYAFDVKWSILSKELIDRCHALGILVYSDALGEHERVGDYLQAMDWGIDVIQTDHPMRLLRAIELRSGE